MGNIKNMGTILVVGDWFVDEYWFISRHHSDVSSHTGPLHYRIVSETTDPVRDLCGAGLVARVLYELRRYDVKGLDEKIKKVAERLDNVRKGDEATRKRFDVHRKQIEGIIKEEKKEKGHTLQQVHLIDCTIRDCELEGIELSDGEGEVENNTSPSSKQYEICGLGRWHWWDNDVLPHFVHAYCRANAAAVRAPFSLVTKHRERPVDARLRNLERKVAHDAKNNRPALPQHSTIRCIRTYSFVARRFEQVNRIDWEPAPSAPLCRDDKHERHVVEAALRDSTAGVVVIIEDHKKAVVNKSLIDNIKKTLSSRPQEAWFVRTKDNGIREKTTWPKWLQAIDTIELLAIGPEIACRTYPINGLLTASDQPAEHAFALINDVISGDKRKVRNVILTSDKLEVVALLGNWCFIAKPSQEIRNIELEKINWTSALFAGLAYEMLTSRTSWQTEPTEARKLLERAIKHAHAHSGVKIPQLLRLSTQTSCSDIFADRAMASDPKTELKRICDWPKMQSDWGFAKSEKGIIKIERDGVRTKRLELSRASTDLPGYIALIEEKREAVRRMWCKIHRFTLRKDIRNSLSILLEADPAVGKSYLAKKLAESVDCSFIYYDISQMIHRDELLDLFDMIATEQAATSRTVFVFVDEIDIKLDGSPVYGAFLSPLEAGNYTRRGRRFELKPSIWMFAGTPAAESTETGNAPKKVEKRPDFESRLTIRERIDYRSMQERANDSERLQGQAQLEQVYLGAKMINDAFNDVHWIDSDLLGVFHGLPPDQAPARRIQRLAASLENVQYGRVHKGNCTSQEWREVIGSGWEGWARFDVNEKTDYVEFDLS